MTQKSKQRELNLKGEAIYDYREDILLFKARERTYSHSLELANFAIDIDREGYVTAIQVFDASKAFCLPKTALREITAWHFQAAIEDRIVNVILKFSAKMRNRITENFTQQITTELQNKLKNSVVNCVATV